MKMDEYNVVTKGSFYVLLFFKVLKRDNLGAF